MKKTLLFTLFALIGLFAQATTVSFTSSSLEVITANAVTRTFYDIDDVYLSYKAGKLTIYSSESGTQIFYGDTSEVSVTSATIWTAKDTKLSRWYQKSTHTNGNTYYMPRRGVTYLYRGSTSAVRFLNAENKRTLLDTHIDSVVVTGVTGASNKLTWLRNQAFLEGNRNWNSLPDAVTVTAGAAAGTGATATIVGYSGRYQVTLTTGSSASNTGTLFTVTLPFTALNGIIPDVDAGDSDAKTHFARWVATGTTTTIVVSALTTALTDSTVYVFNVSGVSY